jgi:hypothetical protein
VSAKHQTLLHKYAVQAYSQPVAEIPRNHSKNYFFYKWNISASPWLALVFSIIKMAKTFKTN